MTAKSAKSWQARLDKAADALTEQFVESLSVDWRLAKYDIAGSVVHAKMLARVGLISRTELGEIVRGLTSIGQDIDAGRLKADISHLQEAANPKGATVTADVVFKGKTAIPVRYVLTYRDGKLVAEIWQIDPRLASQGGY